MGDLNPFGAYPYRATGGSVVVLDATNGDVLAAASNPDYDPNISIDGFNALEWTILNSKESHYPLVDRATSGLYAPGSTFKLVSSFAAVTAGVRGQFVGFDDSSGCYTSKYASDQKKKCNAGLSGTGANVDLATALTRSSDTYFYSVGDELWNICGATNSAGNAIQQWARRFGSAPRRGSHSPSRRTDPRRDLAAQLRVGASQEGHRALQVDAAGYINWNPGDNMNTAVGQGDVLVTPLQLADAYAAFANGGTLWQPRLADAILDGKKVVTSFGPKKRGEVAMDAGIRDQMVAGFTGAVQDQKGTAYKAFQGFPFAQVPVMGKTGTAQVGVRVRNASTRLPRTRTPRSRTARATRRGSWECSAHGSVAPALCRRRDRGRGWARRQCGRADRPADHRSDDERAAAHAVHCVPGEPRLMATYDTPLNRGRNEARVFSVRTNTHPIFHIDWLMLMAAGAVTRSAC